MDTVVDPSGNVIGAVSFPSVAATPSTLALVRLLPLMVKATSCVTTDPENICISCFGSNIHSLGAEKATVTSGPAHAIDTLVTSTSATLPLAPASIVHTCFAGLATTATVYDIPSVSWSGKLKAPLVETVNNVSIPSACSRNATPSAPAQSPCTSPPT